MVGTRATFKVLKPSTLVTGKVSSKVHYLPLMVRQGHFLEYALLLLP